MSINSLQNEILLEVSNRKCYANASKLFYKLRIHCTHKKIFQGICGNFFALESLSMNETDVSETILVFILK